MGIKRVVDTSFWTDGKVDEFTPEDKLFMMYLLTSPFSTQLGIYEISIKQVAFHLGYSMDTVRNLIERFESTYGIIIFSKSTNEIAIKNFLRHSIIKGGKPVEDCIKREMARVKNKSLISKVFSHISDKDDLNETVKKIIGEFQNENHNDNEIQNENDNGNDNDNDVSYHDSYNNSSPVSSKSPKLKKSKPTKHKHGEFQNVLLTDAEFEKLSEDFGSELIDRAIIFLDEYIEEKGYKSKSHNLAIRRWVIEAVQNRSTKAAANNSAKPKKQPAADPFMNELQRLYEQEC